MSRTGLKSVSEKWEWPQFSYFQSLRNLVAKRGRQILVLSDWDKWNEQLKWPWQSIFEKRREFHIWWGWWEPNWRGAAVFNVKLLNIPLPALAAKSAKSFHYYGWMNSLLQSAYFLMFIFFSWNFSFRLHSCLVKSPRAACRRLAKFDRRFSPQKRRVQRQVNDDLSWNAISYYATTRGIFST